MGDLDQGIVHVVGPQLGLTAGHDRRVVATAIRRRTVLSALWQWESAPVRSST